MSVTATGLWLDGDSSSELVILCWVRPRLLPFTHVQPPTSHLVLPDDDSRTFERPMYLWVQQHGWVMERVGAVSVPSR
eukprot:6724-Eustigmatos_ZCMA.PRE.1